MPLSILQVNTTDIGGGAERVAFNLHQNYRIEGYDSWMAVGRKKSRDDRVFEIPNITCKTPWCRLISRLDKSFLGLLSNRNSNGTRRLRRDITWLAEPKSLKDILYGRENFGYPGTWELLNLQPGRPDIIHCHNLHGGYFDLRALPWLCKHVPLVLTLHDAWMLSGHCAHSLECNRWKTGCGQCPNLSVYPSIRRDTTAYNWSRKRQIFLKSRLFVSTPSEWLMKRAEASILSPAIVESRLIPNGIDLGIFHPADKYKVRKILGIPNDINILLSIGNITESTPWKDFKMLESALELVETDKETWLLCLGETGQAKRIGKVCVRFFDFKQNPQYVADLFRASDIYLHPARADTFPNVVLEALACGTPVISTAVGGVQEQVKGWKADNFVSGRLNPEVNRYGIKEATGILTPPGDTKTMALCIEGLLRDKHRLSYMGKNAIQDARERFDQKKQTRSYIEWYLEILSDFSEKRLDPTSHRFK